MLVGVKPTGVIKFTPDDFVVCEVHEGKPLVPVRSTMVEGKQFPFTTFVATKRNIESQQLVEIIADELQINPDQVTTFGKKDKFAQTTQRIVIRGSYTSAFYHPNINLVYRGEGIAPARAGAHDGNFFSILVRTDAVIPPEGTQFRNLFGPQRFGGSSCLAGRWLLEGETTRALALIKGDVREWSKLIAVYNAGNFNAIDDALYSEAYREQRQFKILQWQSYLWNQVAASATADFLPMWSEDTALLFDHLWNPEMLDDEMVKECHTFNRPVWIDVRQHEIIEVEEGFKHEFILRSGAYATSFLAELYDLTDASRSYHKVV